MRRNKTAAFFLAALLSLSLCGCAGARTAGQERKPYIAVITKSTGSNFFKTVFAGVRTASIEYNVDVTMEGADSEENYEEQNAMIKKAVENGADAIVLSAIDYNESVEAMEEAAAAGVKLVVIDSGINSDEVAVKIGTDNYSAGVQAAKAILDRTEGDIQVGVVNFDEGTYNGQERERGFLAALEESGRAQVASVIHVNSNIRDASEGTKAMLSEYPDIRCIAAFNEWTTLGVGYAVQELGIGEETTVVGFDNNVISIGMLETGEVDALVVQNPFAMGYLGIENAYQLINGKKPEHKEVFTETLTAFRENLFDEANQKLIFPFR